MASHEPAWVRILEVLRDSGGQVSVEVPAPDEREYDEVDQEGLLADWLLDAGTFPDEDAGHVADMQTMLENGGLVETRAINRPDGLTVERVTLRITSRGFEVLHDREMRNSQFQINQSIVLFTLALVLVSISGHVPGDLLPTLLDAAVLVFLLTYVWVVRPIEFW